MTAPTEAEREIQALTKQRESIISTLNRHAKFLNSFNSTNSVRNLQNRVLNIKPLLDDFNEIQSKIEAKTGTSGDAEREVFETEYFETLSKCEEIIDRHTVIATNKTEVKLPTNFATNSFANSSNKHATQSTSKPKVFDNSKKPGLTHVVANSNCIKCNESHFLYQCPEFLKLSISARIEEAKNLQLCLNCLKNTNHDAKSCRSRSCKNCFNRHHTVLHLNKRENTNVNNHCACNDNTEILLSTAVIKIKGKNGTYHKARTLLDNGSQQHFITEKLCRELGIELIPKAVPLRGIGLVTNQVSKSAEINFTSLDNNYSKTINCLVLTEITSNLPLKSIGPNTIVVPDNINLADPEFYLSSRIDLLIGAGLFYDLLKDGRIKLNNNQTYAQNSKLGWLIGGPFTCPTSNNISITCHVLSSLEKQVSNFFEIEGYETEKVPMHGNDICESFFRETHQRDADDHFIVNLPFINRPPEIGCNYNSTLKQFKYLENKVSRNAHLANDYHKFMADYVETGHMELVDTFEPINKKVHY